MNVISVLHCHALGHMIDLVDTDQSFSKLKHVVSQADDDELSILRSFFNVTSNDRYLCMLAYVQFSHEGQTYISEIQSGINLVHHIQWRRPVHM